MAVSCMKFGLKIFSHHRAIMVLLTPPTRLFDEKIKKVKFLPFTAKIFIVQMAAKENALVY